MGTKIMKHVKLVLLSAVAIKEGQDAIRKSMVKLDQNVHDNAVQCLAHAAEHGDTSLMRRLLVDIIDAKSGYRRQGLIQWMRKHSPMELKADNIDLSGFIMSEAQQKAMIAAFPDVDPKRFVIGERRPFLVDEANIAPFTSDAGNREQVKPLFQNTLLNPIQAASKRFFTAVENTVNGQPVDPSKPYYDGKHMDAIAKFFETVKEAQANLPADATAELRARQARLREDTAFIDAVTENEAKVEEPKVVEDQKVA
jgi:hypothetical protein